jgi:predicted DCC family thiol-disulfide oxidoreductase YuxK
MGPAVIFYDGVCGFCDRTVRFVLRRDDQARFRFAPLQSDYAAAVLARHGRDAAGLDTVALLLDAGTERERLLVRSDAVLAILRRLGGVWTPLAGLRWLPRRWRDAAYDAFARRRYRWFGRFETCPLPPPALRARLAAPPPDGETAAAQPHPTSIAPQPPYAERSAC